MVQVKKKIREVQCLPPKLLAVVIIVSLGFIAKSQINYLMKASYTISTEQIVTPDTTQETNRNEIALKTNSTDKLSDASSKETKSMEEELKLDSNEEAKKVEQVEINEVQNKSQPEITILLSYPNSGTSYTITTVQAVSKKSSASNYSKESKSKKNLFPDHPEYHGPYLLNNKMDIPKKVLTKTHCWGYKDGRIKYYLVSVKKFPGTCFRSRGLDGKYVGYHKDIIPKTAVRLVRDPFDNIVSNYHLSMKIHHGTKSKSVEEDKKRFQHHCEQKDHTFEKSIKNTNVKMFKTETAKSLMANVPCHQSFFRYVQWHNNANPVTDDLDTLVIFYDDYETKYNETMSKLLNFLELDEVMERKDFPGFKTGLTYRDYYSDEQKAAVSKFLRHFGTQETINLIDRYLTV